MATENDAISNLILAAKRKAIEDIGSEAEPAMTQPVKWPVTCTVGPGLEGAIACESKIGYVNGTRGWLLYRGYDIFDLAAHSTYEEVSYLLLHGKLPVETELADFKAKLSAYRYMPLTLRRIMSFPIENMHAMAALRLGTNLMRQEFTLLDIESARPDIEAAISSDEDSIPMETTPTGEARAIYEFGRTVSGRALVEGRQEPPSVTKRIVHEGSDTESCYHLIAGAATLTAAVARIRGGHMPIEAEPDLSHAANLLYMLTGKKPSPLEERVMDITLILHADHGMNASTFAAMVVASTLSDIYLSIGAGIAALSGPLHGGAKEKVINTLNQIGSVENVKPWYEKARAEKQKIMGFGHRVYKAYDPRARILGPLAGLLVENDPQTARLFRIAKELENEVVSGLGAEKKIFTNVDFYSGLVFSTLGIPMDTFATIFAVSRVAGWTARVLEYLENNRIFRPRAIYTGEFGNNYVPIEER